MDGLPRARLIGDVLAANKGNFHFDAPDASRPVCCTLLSRQAEHILNDTADEHRHDFVSFDITGGQTPQVEQIPCSSLVRSVVSNVSLAVVAGPAVARLQFFGAHSSASGIAGARIFVFGSDRRISFWPWIAFGMARTNRILQSRGLGATRTSAICRLAVRGRAHKIAICTFAVWG